MKRTILLIILAIGLFSNFSCTTKNTAEECSKCKPLPPDQIVTTKIATIDKTFKVWTGGNEDDMNNSYSVASEDHTSNRAEMSGILEFYKIDAGNIIKDYDLVSIVLYATGAINAKVLEKSNVLGAMIYTSTPEQMFIHVFKNTGGRMKLINELSSDTWAVSYNDLYSVAAIFGIRSNIVAWQIGEFKLHGIRKNAKRNLEHKLNKYLDVSYFNISGKAMNILGLEQSLYNGTRCGHPCPAIGKSHCVWPENGDEPFCYPNEERTCAMLTMQPGNNYDWENDPRHPFLYDFRDGVLGANTIGAHIQNDFYYCGSIISGKITSTQARNGFSLIDNHILPIVKRLNNASASSDSSVIFDRSVRDDINAFVADIKTISADPTFQEILDEVTANVNYCEGKTVARIKHELTN